MALVPNLQPSGVIKEDNKSQEPVWDYSTDPLTARGRTSGVASPCHVHMRDRLGICASGVLSVGMKPLCVPWGFDLGLAVVR